MMSTLEALSAKRALLDRLVDDASLYPPAELAMGPSLRAHARDRESAYAFVQGRFVVAASRLGELIERRDPSVPLELSVILDGPAGLGAAAGAVSRIADLALLDGVQGIAVPSFEAKLPVASSEIAGMSAVVEALAGRGAVSLWLEPRYDGGWVVPPSDVLAAIAALRAAGGPVAVGAKCRTGGLTPNAVPSVEDVAAFIVAAHDAGVAWKATAGLHHPVRHTPRGASLPMHGFLNVFFAGIALHAGAIEPARVVEIIAEEDPQAFVLDPLHFAWRDVALEAEAIVAGRAQCVSFGSCSFFEPVDDLRRLGMLS